MGVISPWLCRSVSALLRWCCCPCCVLSHSWAPHVGPWSLGVPCEIAVSSACPQLEATHTLPHLCVSLCFPACCSPNKTLPSALISSNLGSLITDPEFIVKIGNYGTSTGRKQALRDGASLSCSGSTRRLAISRTQGTKCQYF